MKVDGFLVYSPFYTVERGLNKSTKDELFYHGPLPFVKKIKIAR